MSTEVVKKIHTPLWRATPLFGGIIAVVGGLLIGSPSANTTVWVRFLGHRLVVTHGGALASITPMVLLYIGIVIPVWALINAVSTPRSTFFSIGRSKGKWVAMLFIVLLIGDVSLLPVPIYYLCRVRSQLNRDQMVARAYRLAYGIEAPLG
jgi:hypothetical protein